MIVPDDPAQAARGGAAPAPAPAVRPARPLAAHVDRDAAYISFFVAGAAAVLFASLLTLSSRANELSLTGFVVRWGWLLLVAVLAAVYGIQRFRR